MSERIPLGKLPEPIELCILAYAQSFSVYNKAIQVKFPAAEAEWCGFWKCLLTEAVDAYKAGSELPDAATPYAQFMAWVSSKPQPSAP